MENILNIFEQDREFICSKIRESERYEDILYSLYSNQSMSYAIYQDLTSTDTTLTNRIRQLLRYICDAQLFEEFSNALLKEGLNDLAVHINPDATDNFGSDPQHEFHDKMVNLPYIPCSASYPSLHCMPHDIPPGVAHSYPDNLNDRPLEPITIKVIPSNTIFGTDLNDREVYKNSSNPRGLVLIANYDKFSEGKLKERPGSQIDVKNTYDLFTQMGYIVKDPIINFTKKETIQALKRFRDDEQFASVDSCVIVIMSHGYNDRSFCTYDLYISDTEVVTLFNNQHCPNLISKPKIFIFQFCRGLTPDTGVEVYPKLVSNDKNGETLETDAASFDTTVPITHSPSFSDMFIIYATFPGYVSFRNPARGSWLIEAVCIEFMNNSYCCDLEKLMKLVSRRISNFHSDKGRKQVVETRNVAFEKFFYFNPVGSDL